MAWHGMASHFETQSRRRLRKQRRRRRRRYIIVNKKLQYVIKSWLIPEATIDDDDNGKFPYTGFFRTRFLLYSHNQKSYLQNQCSKGC